MENNQEVKKKRLNLSSYGTVVAFLCLEVLAFVSFYLGHSYLLYGILSVVLAILLILVTLRQINKDGITSFAFFLFPLFIFGLLTALSGFSFASLGGISIAETVFIPIGLTLFALSGYLSSHIKTFKMQTALMVIYGALALFVFINLVATMVYYVPFYTLIYRNSYIVYHGKPSPLPIGSMAYMLYGFQIKEVTLTYWTLFPSLLFTSVIALFFIKYKENKRDFLIYLGFSILGFISLLFTISKITLITDVVLILGITIILLCAKLNKSRRVIDGVMIGLGIIFVLFVIFEFVIAQKSWGWTKGLRNTISQSALLNRLFIANRFSNNVLVILQDLFSTFKLFGCPVGDYGFNYPNGVPQVISNLWIFDNLMSSGLFGAIFFIIALFFALRRFFKYIAKSQDLDVNKYLIAGFVLGFFVLSLVLLDVYPLVNSINMSPFFISSPLLISLFLLGYTYHKSSEKVEEVVSEPKEEKLDEIIAA